MGGFLHPQSRICPTISKQAADGSSHLQPGVINSIGSLSPASPRDAERARSDDRKEGVEKKKRKEDKRKLPSSNQRPPCKAPGGSAWWGSREKHGLAKRGLKHPLAGAWRGCSHANLKAKFRAPASERRLAVAQGTLSPPSPGGLGWGPPWGLEN